MFSRLQLALDTGVCAKVFQSIGFLNSYCSQIMSEPPLFYICDYVPTLLQRQSVWKTTLILKKKIAHLIEHGLQGV